MNIPQENNGPVIQEKELTRAERALEKAKPIYYRSKKTQKCYRMKIIAEHKADINACLDLLDPNNVDYIKEEEYSHYYMDEKTNKPKDQTTMYVFNDYEEIIAEIMLEAMTKREFDEKTKRGDNMME